MHASIHVHTRVRTHVCPPTHIIARRGLHQIMRTYGHAQMHGHTHIDTHKCAQAPQPIPIIFTSPLRRERRLHSPAPREGRGIVITLLEHSTMQSSMTVLTEPSNQHFKLLNFENTKSETIEISDKILKQKINY